MNATPETSLVRSKRFSIAELNELWRLRGLGRSPQSIGRVLGRSSRSVYAVIVRAGGIKPVPRHRSDRHLSPDEREEISRRLACRESIRSIAKALGSGALDHLSGGRTERRSLSLPSSPCRPTSLGARSSAQARQARGREESNAQSLRRRETLAGLVPAADRRLDQRRH